MCLLPVWDPDLTLEIFFCTEAVYNSVNQIFMLCYLKTQFYIFFDHENDTFF